MSSISVFLAFFKDHRASVSHAEGNETTFAGAVLYADYVVVRWIVLQTMVRTYNANVRRTANEQKSPILIFQGDSLWGSLHVLLFNTVSGYISAS